ncbi:hypothetical protein ACFWQ6_00965 [Streptomyces coelicoflavus]|uniref:hypothetical protein n=1 Tax=Streptomyces coelicoflavus TaxID=285562 RepID=UPI0036602912
MSTLNLIAIGIGLLAVLLLCFGAGDALFFGLLSAACLVGAMGEAYRENKPGAVGFLISAALLALISGHAAYRDSRRGGRT